MSWHDLEKEIPFNVSSELIRCSPVDSMLKISTLNSQEWLWSNSNLKNLFVSLSSWFYERQEMEN